MEKETELNKWAEAQPTMGAIRDFLDWCETQKMELAVYRPSGKWLSPLAEGREQMLARYLGIDLKQLETERRLLLSQCGGRNHG